MMCTEQERIDANITREKYVFIASQKSCAHREREMMYTQLQRNEVQAKECSEGHVYTCQKVSTCIHFRRHSRVYMLEGINLNTCQKASTCIHVRRHQHVYMLEGIHVYTCQKASTCIHVRRHSRVYILEGIHVYSCKKASTCINVRRHQCV